LLNRSFNPPVLIANTNPISLKPPGDLLFPCIEKTASLYRQ
jgi:hypothetical protein